MGSHSRRGLRLLGGAAAFSLVIGAQSLVADPAQAVAPSGLHVTDVSAHAVGLAWNPISGAREYRVSYSTDASSWRTWDVYDTSIEWTNVDGNPGKVSARLSASTRYYFRVKAISITNESVDLSSYTAPLSVTTAPESSYSELAPVELTATANGNSGLYVSWKSRGPGYAYQVSYGTDADLSGAATATFTTSGGVLTGLRAATRYYYKVRVMAGSAPASDFSDVASGTTAAAAGSPQINVVSYNILKVGSGPSWAGRRVAVADNILGQNPDIVELQEATPARYNGVRQYTDLLNLLNARSRDGAKFAYVTKSEVKAQYSSGTQLAYDTTRFSVTKSGSQILAKLGSSRRYAVWAVLKDKKSAKSLIVVDTHLEPPKGSASKGNSVRIKQARQIVSLIAKQNPNRYPVLVAGDMNSSRATKPNNGPYNEFRKTLVDPIGNSNDTWYATVPGIVEHPLDLEYNSYNNLERRARRTAYPVGTHVDYIFVSKGVRVAQYRTVVTVDQNGSFVGTIPSDHNLISAAIHLP